MWFFPPSRNPRLLVQRRFFYMNALARNTFTMPNAGNRALRA